MSGVHVSIRAEVNEIFGHLEKNIPGGSLKGKTLGVLSQCEMFCRQGELEENVIMFYFYSVINERSALAEVKATACGNVSTCGEKTFDILLVSNMVKDELTEELLRYMIHAAPVVVFCLNLGEKRYAKGMGSFLFFREQTMSHASTDRRLRAILVQKWQ